VAAIDIVVPDLQDIISRVIFYNTGFLYLVDLSSGIVLNDPFSNSVVYHIWDSNVTGITMDAWNQISDNSTTGQVLEITDTNGNAILIIRNFISTAIPTMNFMLMIHVPSSEAYAFLCK
jgi:hypothetical protein